MNKQLIFAAVNTRPNFKIVLITPEIPGNTGSIGRTCVALNLELILIHPLGFDISDKAVKRAGLDYWQHLRLTEYQSWEAYLEGEKPRKEQMYFFENDGKRSFIEAKEISTDAHLIFGGETKGLPGHVYQSHLDRIHHLPMFSEHIRSLNLASTATAAIYLGMSHLES